MEKASDDEETARYTNGAEGGLHVCHFEKPKTARATRLIGGDAHVRDGTMRGKQGGQVGDRRGPGQLENSERKGRGQRAEGRGQKAEGRRRHMREG